MPNLLSSFFVFLARPVFSMVALSAKQKLFYTIRVWSFIYLLTLIVALVSTMLFRAAGVLQENVVGDLIQDQPIFLIIFLVSIWAPIWEETAFRLAMKPSTQAISLGIAAFIQSVLSIFNNWFGWNLNLPVGIGSANQTMMFLLWFGLMAWTIFLLIDKTKFGDGVLHFWNRRFGVVFYTFTLTFALVHFSNFQNSSSVWFLAPLAVLPQFFVAIGAGFARSKFGFWWAVLLHFLHNTITLLPILLLKLSPNPNLLSDSADPSKLTTFDQMVVGGVGILYMAIFLGIIVINTLNFVEYFQKKNLSHEEI